MYTSLNLPIITLANQIEKFFCSTPGSLQQLLYLWNLDLLVILESPDIKANPPPVRFSLWFSVIPVAE